MENFSFDRIGALLRYDWTLHKHKFQMMTLITILLYVLLVITILAFNGEVAGLRDEANEHLPKILGDSCNSFFEFAKLAMWLLTTMLLTEKFCNPRTATNYLAIPGTTIEKFTVMALDYVIAFLAIGVLFVVTFYVTMGIGHLFSPELEWGRSILGFYSPGEILKEMKAKEDWNITIESARFWHEMNAILNASLYINFFAYFASVALHGVICMFFKSNVQVKAILIELLMLVVMIIVILGIVIGYAVYAKTNHLPEVVVKQTGLEALFWFRIFLYLQPLFAAAFCYIFYRQLRCKQAK